MKQSVIIVFGILVSVCGFVVLFSTSNPEITLQSKSIFERMSQQWNQVRDYVQVKVDSISSRVRGIRSYIETNIILPLKIKILIPLYIQYIRLFGLPRADS